MSLTIVMYHYVRDLAHSRYPEIKGLTCKEFDGQLDYISDHHKVCSLRDVVASLRGDFELPANACLLTFDDGLIDHYLYVFPRLVERGWSGSFFPAAQPLRENIVLDVHKIHFVLASCPDKAEIVSHILGSVPRFSKDYLLPSPEELYRQHAVAGRFDPPEVIFIKRVLQSSLPEAVRQAIVAELFEKYVYKDEAAFARELYMDASHLRTMARAGMEIGGHGYKHLRLGLLPTDEQAAEIAETQRFLSEITCADLGWTISYPYGSHNDQTLRLVREAGAVLGLTVEPKINHSLHTPLQLHRLDTRDLPCSRN